MIRLVVLDAPTGKGRPRFNRQSGRVYTPAKTTNAEARVRHAWDVAGRPTIPEGTPIRMRIELYVDRPMAHYKRDGSLTTAGEREPIPHRQKPDCDNAAKLIADSLERYAYPRDVAIVDLHVTRHWVAGRSDPPRVEITLDPL